MYVGHVHIRNENSLKKAVPMRLIDESELLCYGKIGILWVQRLILLTWATFRPHRIATPLFCYNEYSVTSKEKLSTSLNLVASSSLL